MFRALAIIYLPMPVANLQVFIPMECQEFVFWIEEGIGEERRKEREGISSI